MKKKQQKNKKKKKKKKTTKKKKQKKKKQQHRIKNAIICKQNIICRKNFGPNFLVILVMQLSFLLSGKDIDNILLSI